MKGSHSKSNEDAGTRSNAYVPTAPKLLKEIHTRSPSGQVSAVLGRLLTASQMEGVWRELSKRANGAQNWREHWGAISAAFIYSARVDRVPSRAMEQKRFDDVAKRARDLAKIVRGREMDLLAYELFPPEAMRLLGVRDWEDLDAWERDQAANKRLSYWPGTAELLDRLAYVASVRAHNAMQSPKLVERTTRDARQIAFVRLLVPHFKRTVGTPMYGTVATITSTALERECDKAFVISAIKRTSPKLDLSIAP